MNGLNKPGRLVGEQYSIVFYTILVSVKFILVSFILRFIDQKTVQSLGLTLSSYILGSYVFIVSALLNKNIFQMKLSVVLSLLEVFYDIVVIIETQKNKYLVIILMVINVIGIVFNLFSIKRAIPEFEWYYFKNVSINPDEIGKLKL